MKHTTKIIAISLVFFIGCALTISAQQGTLEAHAASKVKINKTKAAISKGDTLQLRVTGTKKKAKWSSDKKSIATVSSKGKVTGKKNGKATITAKVGGKKYTCKVTVTKPDYKKLIVGMWEGRWIDGGYIELAFFKNGKFHSSTHYDSEYDSTQGFYRIKGNKLELDTGDIFTIKSITRSKLTLKTMFGTRTLQGVTI